MLRIRTWGRRRFRHFKNSLAHYKAVGKILGKESLYGLSALNAIVLYHIFLIMVFSVFLELIQENFNTYNSVWFDFTLFVLLILPITKIISVIFVTYVGIIEYIARNTNRYFKTRVPPYGKNNKDVELIPKEVSPAFVKTKFKYWRTYANAFTVLYISSFFVLDHFRFFNNNSSSFGAAFDVIIDVVIIIPIIGPIASLGADYIGTESTMDGLIILLFVIPALVYAIPMKNQLEYTRQKRRDAYRENGFKNTLKSDAPLLFITTVILFTLFLMTFLS